jgi:hypothetical protein
MQQLREIRRIRPARHPRKGHRCVPISRLATRRNMEGKSLPKNAGYFRTPDIFWPVLEEG